MKKFSMFAITAASLLLLTGCGEDKKAALALYNNYVTAIDMADYETAFQLTDATNNPFMTPEIFEESLNTLGVSYKAAIKAKKSDDRWKFTVGDSESIYTIKDNKLAIPEIYTSLDLYVPTGSSCSYNNVPLTDDLITESDELETVYTIPNAPICTGNLHIDTVLFGSSDREVDPEIGDYNDFELSDEMTTDVGNLIIKEINNLNSTLETGDINQFKTVLSKFVIDVDEQQELTDNLCINRKLSEPFTSYRGISYTINNIKVDFTTSTIVDATVDFTAVWTIGENKTGTMDTIGEFSVERTDAGWNMIAVDKWDFMFLNALGGE